MPQYILKVYCHQYSVLAVYTGNLVYTADLVECPFSVNCNYTSLYCISTALRSGRNLMYTIHHPVRLYVEQYRLFRRYGEVQEFWGLPMMWKLQELRKLQKLRTLQTLQELRTLQELGTFRHYGRCGRYCTTYGLLCPFHCWAKSQKKVRRHWITCLWTPESSLNKISPLHWISTET